MTKSGQSTGTNKEPGLWKWIVVREAAKKVLILVTRPIMPPPPPSSLVATFLLELHKKSFFLCGGQAQAKKIFAASPKYQRNRRNYLCSTPDLAKMNYRGAVRKQLSATSVRLWRMQPQWHLLGSVAGPGRFQPDPDPICGKNSSRSNLWTKPDSTFEHNRIRPSNKTW